MGSPGCVGDDFSDIESDEVFKEDMDSLREACRIVNTSPGDLNKPSAAASAGATPDDGGVDEGDFELLRSIRKRYLDMGESEDLSTMTPLCELPPGLSDCDGDDGIEEAYETVRAIQRRFASYDEGGGTGNANLENPICRPLLVGATTSDSQKETSDRFVDRTNAREGFLDYAVDNGQTICHESAAGGSEGLSDLVKWNKPIQDDISRPPVWDSQFPKTALGFVDAIKKNRSYQKFIRNKMLQVEAKLEELKKLTERVKILKDFQAACKKRIGRALSQKRDARVQLISVQKPKKNPKVDGDKIRALDKGPRENGHVAKYRQAMAAHSVTREKWSKEERENLVKGVKQQFQGMLLQRSVDHISEVEGSCEPGNIDSVMGLIKDLEITPEQMRLFLPKVNWEQLAAMYVPRRSGAECHAMFLNFEDPLINHNPWTKTEDKKLLSIVRDNGLKNLIDIAALMGGTRTPFQCLARYQRSLNATILRSEWSKEEDNKLRAAVETYGEGNWQSVASVMEGRAGTQCSNRWIKSLHPGRKKVGKWSPEEDKRLKVAVTLFGRKWKEVASHVPGRTHPQCRERWVNSLDPSINKSQWTKEEDLKLKEAVAELGYCWSKVAARVPHRTDNQCWRRWKVLCPEDVPRIQEARKIRKIACISNFVDRESEKPSLGPDDFQVPETFRIAGLENAAGRKKKSRKLSKNASPSGVNSEEVPMSANRSKDTNTHHQKSACSRGRCKKSHSSEKDSDFAVSEDRISCDNDNDVSESNTTTKSRQKRKPRHLKRRSSVEDSALVLIGACEEVNKRNPCANLGVENIFGGESTELECCSHSTNQAVEAAGKLHPRRNKKCLKTSNNSTEDALQRMMEVHEIEEETVVVGNVKEKRIEASSGNQSSYNGDEALSGNLELVMTSFEGDSEFEDNVTIASFMRAVARKKGPSIT